VILDHIIALNEPHLRRIMFDYVTYHHDDRLHDSLEKDAPKRRPIEQRPGSKATVIALPRLGGLVTDGGRFGGYGFYLLKGRPVFTWNLVQLERVKWQGNQALAPGKHVLEFDWKYDGPGLGKSGTGTLKVDGQVLDSHLHATQFGSRHSVV
jgi:hypothetical protein